MPLLAHPVGRGPNENGIRDPNRREIILHLQYGIPAPPSRDTSYGYFSCIIDWRSGRSIAVVSVNTSPMRHENTRAVISDPCRPERLQHQQDFWPHNGDPQEP
jgi:hypothetical protein